VAPQEYELEFYVDPETDDSPVTRWLLGELSPLLRRLLGAAMRAVLQVDGIGVCDGEFGKQLGAGLFEFRVNGNPQALIDEERRRRGKQPKKIDPPAEAVLLRVFCHAYGKRVVLLLGGYDKASDSSAKRQNKEIETARARLRKFLEARKKAAKAEKKKGGH
jgi:hypothetical protein